MRANTGRGFISKALDHWAYGQHVTLDFFRPGKPTDKPYMESFNGSLTPQTTLCWDEPEANLNPALLRKLAAILAELAHQGFQIILATHSMSLLKEFHILSRESDKEKLPIKYFGLNAEPGQPTTVVTREDFKYLPDVVALEVELDQADDLEEIFARESR